MLLYEGGGSVKEFLFSIDRHAAMILCILIAVVIGDIVIHLLTDSRKRQSFQKKTGREQRALLNLQEKGDEAFVLVRSKTGIPVYVSESIEVLFGIRADSIYADRTVILRGFSKAEQERLMENYKKREDKEKFVFEAPWTMEQGQKECQITILHNENDLYDLLIMRDVTIQKERIDQLEKEIIETRHSEESKTVFLSNMSHEIRTPLNGMLGMIGLTKMNLDKPETAREYLNKSEELSNLLLSVINDILDMSRIESGKTELEAVAFDIRGLGEKLNNMFQATLEDKGIHFRLEMEEIQEPFVVGDQLRISQVLTNFLSNSSKFTPQGGDVVLTIKQMDVVEDKVSWMFRVKDTGKGMSPSFLHRIFKPFEQEDSGITRKYGGSGLGMAIADNLVKLMGGQILVESELEKGTTFTVFLKLPKADVSEIEEIKKEDDDQEAISLQGRRFLLAEDQPVNALIVVKMLGTKGVEVEIAKDGVEAVDMFKAHESGYYDAILMDIHMPRMDGWDAARLIRSSGKAQAMEIPIFALSADAFVEDKRKSIEAGMNGHITKPIDYNELERKLQKSLK